MENRQRECHVRAVGKPDRDERTPFQPVLASRPAEKVGKLAGPSDDVVDIEYALRKAPKPAQGAILIDPAARREYRCRRVEPFGERRNLALITAGAMQHNQYGARAILKKVGPCRRFDWAHGQAH